MSKVTVDLESAREKLEDAWSKLDSGIAASAQVSDRIKEALLTSGVAFRYILVTGILAKLTNSDAHPRALQAKSELVGAYDARSLCHKVVVPFEKKTGSNLFGLSNEPMVGKAARHPEHDKNNPQLRSKASAAVVHDLLEHARASTPAEVEAMLVAMLRVAKDRAGARVVATADLETNLGHVVEFVQRFLEQADAGSRLAAVTGAYVTLLSQSYVVRVYQSTTSDQYAGTTGDIEVFADKTLIAAYECKHRPLSVDDVQHGIRKALGKGVPEYCFVIAAGVVSGQRDAIFAAINDASESLDVSLIDIHDALIDWSVLLNSIRRAGFGDTVATILRKDMRRPDVADVAAELWNSLK